MEREGEVRYQSYVRISLEYGSNGENTRLIGVAFKQFPIITGKGGQVSSHDTLSTV